MGNVCGSWKYKVVSPMHFTVSKIALLIKQLMSDEIFLWHIKLC